MTRFFFDTSDGSTALTDDEGMDFTDLEAARYQAVIALGEMAKEAAGRRSLRFVTVRIRDRSGPIFEAQLALEARTIS
jgi:hypothetical protein